jgi:surfactin synthase thioesterase subunit
MLTNFVFLYIEKVVQIQTVKVFVGHSYGGVMMYEIYIVYTCTGFMYQL